MPLYGNRPPGVVVALNTLDDSIRRSSRYPQALGRLEDTLVMKRVHAYLRRADRLGDP